jgi:hypothetical protein
MNTMVQQPAQNAVLASATLTLGHYVAEAVKFIDEFDKVPDAVTKLSVLVDLEEHLEDWRNLIENERAPLERQRHQDVLVELNQFAEERDYESVEKMLADLGVVLSSPVQDKVTAEPELAAESDTQAKVHPNPKRKVLKYLLIGDHDNYKRGHNGSFTGQKPAWAKPYMNGKVIDDTKFRLATADEIAAMEALVQAELDNYKPRKSKGAAALPKP